MNSSRNLFIFTAVLLGVVVSSAHAATITVTSTADEVLTNGQCSLREAVGNANNGTAFPDCAAGQPDATAIDAIVFAPNVTGKITLAQHASYKISSSLSITGPGAGVLSLDADDFSRIFDINGGSVGVDVTVTGLTLINGNPFGETVKDGGAILVAGINDELFLRDSVLTANQGVAGGAIFTAGFSEIDRCSFVDNEGINGGAIANVGVTAILHTAVTGNEAVVSGGGVLNSGIFAAFNSTIAENIAALNGGGVVNDDFGNVSLSNVTITRNVADNDEEGNGDGGGLFSSSQNTDDTISLSNSILSGNEDRSAGNEGPECFGPHFLSQGHNLLRDVTGCDLSADGPGDIVGTDPLLGTLAANGGPTLTFLPLAGSPAIDGGNDAESCFSDDQRGFERPVDADGDGVVRCDIGAVEVAAPASAGGTTGGTTGGVDEGGDEDDADGTTGEEDASGNSSTEEDAPASGGCSLIR